MDTGFRYFIHLAFNGSGYFGWQIQRQKPTIQQQVNEALSKIFRAQINVNGCGRTDAGVHAREFYAHFNLDSKLTMTQRKTMVKKLNGYLPEEIAVFDLIPVIAKANARFDAISRTYRYYMLQNKDPFYNNLAYTYMTKLDIDLMNTGAEILTEFNDFTSFSKVNTQVKTNICKVSEAGWTIEKNMLVFTITADRFLRNMVRAIVGTLLDMGKGKTDETGLREIIEKKDRSAAGYSVPAKGLFLEKVIYPSTIFTG